MVRREGAASVVIFNTLVDMSEAVVPLSGAAWSTGKLTCPLAISSWKKGPTLVKHLPGGPGHAVRICRRPERPHALSVPFIVIVWLAGRVYYGSDANRPIP